MTTASAYLTGPKQAHEEITRLWKEHIRPHAAKGGHAVIEWKTASQVLHERYRKAFHGPILDAFVEQAQPLKNDGTPVRWSKEAYKELLRDWFLPMVPTEYVDQKTGEVRTRMVKQSTTDLGDDEYSLFLLQSTAFGALEFGITFDHIQ